MADNGNNVSVKGKHGKSRAGYLRSKVGTGPDLGNRQPFAGLNASNFPRLLVSPRLTDNVTLPAAGKSNGVASEAKVTEVKTKELAIEPAKESVPVAVPVSAPALALATEAAPVPTVGPLNAAATNVAAHVGDLEEVLVALRNSNARTGEISNAIEGASIGDLVVLAGICKTIQTAAGEKIDQLRARELAASLGALAPGLDVSDAVIKLALEQMDPGQRDRFLDNVGRALDVAEQNNF